MANVKVLMADILFGMSAPARLFDKPSYPSLRGTDLDRLRGDVCRVGQDFTTVLNRENAKESSKHLASKRGK